MAVLRAANAGDTISFREEPNIPALYCWIANCSQNELFLHRMWTSLILTAPTAVGNVLFLFLCNASSPSTTEVTEGEVDFEDDGDSKIEESTGTPDVATASVATVSLLLTSPTSSNPRSCHFREASWGGTARAPNFYPTVDDPSRTNILTGMLILKVFGKKV
ncbi:hypothetical protein LIPSTDRAFT_229702 [Lipomyces starkeyi NRRL Y-11557]|uniref:Uncharacterized protein n=1 Tax=Lipomyces starkeyi NRRL Y-11557 TaxID=675824 RepID=A0A1E3QCG8_LIPST|nr:hypothetical protein LIPSTDRAFT_229702 [Lipomyces starkeyi NRRL Y-11557]